MGNCPKRMLFRICLIFAIYFIEVNSLIPFAASHDINSLNIQELIKSSNPGDTIKIPSGTYCEILDIDKMIYLTGIDTGNGMPIIAPKHANVAVCLRADGIRLDGFSVINPSGIGVELVSNNSIVANNNISGNIEGIVILNCSSNSIAENLVENNTKAGLHFYGSSRNNVTNNLISNNGNGMLFNKSHENCIMANSLEININGINLYNSNGNILIDNTIRKNKAFGINLVESQKNVLKDNSMDGNKYNFKSEDVNDIDTSNLINTCPIYYLINAQKIVINSTMRAGSIYCINCNNIYIENQIIKDNGIGIYFQNTSQSLVDNVTLIDNLIGIYIANSSCNNISINDIASVSSLYSKDHLSTYINNSYSNIIFIRGMMYLGPELGLIPYIPETYSDIMSKSRNNISFAGNMKTNASRGPIIRPRELQENQEHAKNASCEISSKSGTMLPSEPLEKVPADRWKDLSLKDNLSGPIVMPHKI